jgi:hypothetical protein
MIAPRWQLPALPLLLLLSADRTPGVCALLTFCGAVGSLKVSPAFCDTYAGNRCQGWGVLDPSYRAAAAGGLPAAAAMPGVLCGCCDPIPNPRSLVSDKTVQPGPRGRSKSLCLRMGRIS